MTLAELLVAMVIAIVILQGVVGFFIGQAHLVGEQASRRTARDVVRSAMHTFMADLRRLESSGAVEAASAEAVTVRVPFALGVVCSSTTAAATLSVMPTDSVLFASAELSGYAWRAPGGAYTYIGSGVSMSSASSTDCAAESIETLAGGRVVVVAPGPAGAVAVATPVLLYQRARYEFREQTRGSTLVRTLVETGEAEVLVELFDVDGTRFRFFTDPGADAQDQPPADLGTITGLEIVLEGMGDAPQPGRSIPTKPLTTAVFFKN